MWEWILWNERTGKWIWNVFVNLLCRQLIGWFDLLRSFSSLTQHSLDWLADWLFDRSVDRFIDWSIDCLIGFLACFIAGLRWCWPAWKGISTWCATSCPTALMSTFRTKTAGPHFISLAGALSKIPPFSALPSFRKFQLPGLFNLHIWNGPDVHFAQWISFYDVTLCFLWYFFRVVIKSWIVCFSCGFTGKGVWRHVSCCWTWTRRSRWKASATTDDPLFTPQVRAFSLPAPFCGVL